MSADYRSLVADFLSLLTSREVPFVIVGAIALLQHVKGRNTDHIDLIVSSPQLESIPEFGQLLSRSEQPDAFFLHLLGPCLLDSDRQELSTILFEIRGRLRRIGERR